MNVNCYADLNVTCMVVKNYDFDCVKLPVNKWKVY